MSSTTGYFKTADQRTAWVMADYRNMLTYGIAFNPRGAYNVVKATWPDYKNLENGMENITGEQSALYDFLIDKANRSGNPTQFAANFLHQIPPTPTSHLTFLITA